MTLNIKVDGAPIRVTARPLTAESFSPFGSVIQNPRPDLHPSNICADALPPTATSANQGHAIRYHNVSPMQNLYAQAPSGSGTPVMSVFVCAARQLSKGSFPVHVLERHPFTTQTFAPLASSANTYLVVVAPSAGRVPDLRRLEAFVARNTQAVTYAAGMWHAPMVVLGEEGTTLDFVVSQFASGVSDEDCELVEYEGMGVVDVMVTGAWAWAKL